MKSQPNARQSGVMEAACRNCRHGKDRFMGVDNFECRRHAPIAVHDPNKNFGVYPEAFVPRWPHVQGNDWCGDFDQPNAKQEG